MKQAASKALKKTDSFVPSFLMHHAAVRPAAVQDLSTVPADGAFTTGRDFSRLALSSSEPARCGFTPQRCPFGGACHTCPSRAQAPQSVGLQRKTANSARPSEIPPIVQEVLHSPGRALDQDTRAFFEPRFGHDFGHVRVHSDAKAGESARAVNALAYTVGRDVVFSAGQFPPQTTAGLRTLAHELIHTIQQSDVGSVGGVADIDSPDSLLERETDRATARVLGDHDNSGVPKTGAVLTRAIQNAGSSGRGLLQRVSFGEFLSRLFFEGTFSDAELLKYLRYLDDHAAIEGSYDSDNKARAIIRRWRAGDPKFRPTLTQKQLMLLELIDGPTLDADEHAILELLRGSSEYEVRMLIGTAGGEESLRGEFHGSESDELDAFLANWHQDPHHRPVAAGEIGRGRVTIRQIVVNQDTPQVVTLRYSDGRIETNTCSAGKGTCCVEPGSDAAPTAGETHVTDSNWTPVGRHVVQFTQADHNGIKWWTQFNSRGIALHEYEPVDGTPLSHGCVRLNAAFAKRIYQGVLSLQNAPRGRATVVRVTGRPRPRCGHAALMKEWEKDFSAGTGQPRDGEAVHLRRHLRLAYGGVSDTELDRQIAAGSVPRCGGTRRARYTP